jgi:microcystin-dependent protein
MPETTALTGWFESVGLKPLNVNEFQASGIVSGTGGNLVSHGGSQIATKSPRVTVNANHNHVLDDTGKDEAHNNLQPYVTVHMWRRTA